MAKPPRFLVPAVGVVFFFAVASTCGAASYSGTVPNARLGTAVAGVGDVNGDGFDDIVVAAPFDGNGKVFLFYGNSAGAFGAPDWIYEGVQTPEGTFNGARPHFGTSVAGIGDLNADGYDDFVVGAPEYGWVSGPGPSGFQSAPPGGAFVFYGSALFPVAGESTSGGNQPVAQYGYLVAGAGDITGTGVPRYLVSEAPALTPFNVRVYPGTVGANFLYEPGASFGFGRATAGGCNLNGDIFDDIVVNSLSTQGVNAYFGSPGGLSNTPSMRFSGPLGFGTSLACAGNVDGDAYDDLLVGRSSAASLHPGSSAGPASAPVWSSNGGAGGSHFGASVALADVNGDGSSDVIVGAFDRGMTYVFPGSPGGPAIRPLWMGDPTGQAAAHSGASVANAGDYNGDGREDLIIGAPEFFSAGVPYVGRVDLLLSLPACGDVDSDTYSDCEDNCPLTSNASQADADADQIGDACDNCPSSSNTNQIDFENDLIGDACDNCQGLFNSDQADADGDLLGDTCDNCPQTTNADQNDGDSDGVGDACDSCPTYPNPHQGPCPNPPFTATIEFGSPVGKGSGVVRWTTIAEHDIVGFNIVRIDFNGTRTVLTPNQIPCVECQTGLGASYATIIAKHKSGQGIYVEQLHIDGRIDTYGPALRQ